VLEKKLTEDEILAQCYLFFIAGYDTTAITLSYCTYELALNPSLQDKLYEETKEAFNEKGEMDYSVLSRLPFIDALLSETLRHYCPALRLEREAMEDVMLGNTGAKIQKGETVEIPIYAIHHDPDYYPDPFTFNPDRSMPGNRDRIQPYTYLPFGSGPRNCIGMRFVLLSAKLVLAKISHSFRFSRVTDTDVPLIYTTTLYNKLQLKRLVVGIQKR
jgi:cytochrome P450